MLPSIEQRLSLELAARPEQVAAAIALLDEGATVPFIARYRKEATGGLDDTQLRLLEERLPTCANWRTGVPRSLPSIEEQGKMTPAAADLADACGRQDAAGRPVPALQEKAPHQGANRARGRTCSRWPMRCWRTRCCKPEEEAGKYLKPAFTTDQGDNPGVEDTKAALEARARY